MNAKEREKEEYKEKLRGVLAPGDVVYTTVRHVSRSGMRRAIDVHIIRDEEPLWLSYQVAKALGWHFNEKNEAVDVDGCGMDMGFHIVYELSRALFPKGFECVGEGKCRSNDHTNGDRNYEPHHHQDGGYALRQRWL